MSAPKKSTGYIDLLKRNPAFRNLWYAQVISELGDWLNSIAIFTLVLQLSSTGMAMAAAMMAKLLPIFFVSPIAGVVVDRFDRKTVMVVSDVLRFLVVLGFLWVDDPSDLWLVYTLTIVEIGLAGFFEPARSALIPSLTSREDLVTANALSGSTWSVMLALGAALGGGVVALFGIRTAFVLDAFTFLLSAVFVFKIVIQPKTESTSPPEKPKGGWQDLKEGYAYLIREPVILAIALVKSGLAVAGGIMTLIPLYAHTMFSTPAKVSLATGVMYSFRGLGAALGPVLVKRLFGDSSAVLRWSILAGFIFGGGGYLLFAQSVTLWSASLTLGLATLFGSIIWVFSSALIHLEAQDRFFGRIFSLEMAMLTLVMGLSNGAVGWAMDVLQLTPQEVAQGLALLFFVPGLMWLGFLLFVDRKLKAGECVGSVCPVTPSDAKRPATSV